MHLRTFVPIFLVTGCLFYLFLGDSVVGSLNETEKINGISLVNPPFIIDSSKMAEINRLHPGWVAVIPFGFSRENEPGVHFNHQRQWWGERKAGSAELIQLAHQNKLQVMLKPHVWLRGQWIGDFDLDSESKWLTWEKKYREYILTFARLADSMDVALFCIGTELKIPAVSRPDYWKELIGEIRLVYKGKLTYASNWDNYKNISFWEKLDYIGVDGYFPLLGDSDPDVSALEEAWKPIVSELQAFSEWQDRPILFTEYGYQSLNGATGNHWEVVKSNDNLNLDLQAKAYECMYRALWSKSWFAGGFLWKWHFREGAGGLSDGNFTPQGKPAEGVIARWYGKNQREALINFSD